MFNRIPLPLLLALVSMLSACQSGMPPTPAPMLIPVAPVASIPSNLLVTCPPLPQASDGMMATLLANHVEVAKLYYMCRATHSNLIDAIRGQKGIYVDPMGSPGTSRLDVPAFSLSMLSASHEKSDLDY